MNKDSKNLSEGGIDPDDITSLLKARDASKAADKVEQSAKKKEAQDTDKERRRDAAKEAAKRTKEKREKTAASLKAKLKARRQNLTQRSKEAQKLRKQNPTLGDKFAKYKPKFSSMSRIGKDEGSVTATGKLAANVAKAGVNVAKGVVGAAAGARRLKSRIDGGNQRDRAAMKAKAAQRMVDKTQGEVLKAKTKSSKPTKKFTPPKPPMKEEFLNEIDKKMPEEKLDKIIDIMKGKNKVKVNPDMKEQVNTENWKDNYVATEYETVDLIKPEPLNASDWRQDLKIEGI